MSENLRGTGIFLTHTVYKRSVRTDVKMRLNDDLMELMTDAGQAWWTVTNTLQYLTHTYIHIILVINLYKRFLLFL